MPYSVPMLIGCCLLLAIRCPTFYFFLWMRFPFAGFLAAITFHAYAFHNGGGPELSEHMLQVALLDQQAEIYDKMLAVVRNGSSEAYRPAVWMGEGNAAGHGGRPGITNTFANSFWYSNAMGHAASHGISRFLYVRFGHRARCHI